ncbi:PepSY domain-containing protein [Scytonema sp. UIC 10036]|uniref:PepSY domain-containing protein n=1 Tax=Scytonema sp. UIC 10036 TaxID=2304196 RepID=UPI0012DAAF16|nr:PepSY domain-containing protein [Scytonema sp. UIC 10036]MUG99735.1 PepSY domain-containing protein [Scytonema sp. UIC 10036]
MKLNSRKIHRKIAPILFLPLLASALTGIAYRVGRYWFNIPNQVANFFMVIHQGEYLGQPLVPIYVLLVGLGLIGMIVTGLSMTKLFGKNRPSPKSSKLDFRKIHRILAPITFLPLTVSALTGIMYRLGRNWFGMPNEQTALLLRIHQGTYLGPHLRVLYVILIGLGLVAMLITGINLTGIFRKSVTSDQ